MIEAKRVAEVSPRLRFMVGLGGALATLAALSGCQASITGDSPGGGATGAIGLGSGGQGSVVSTDPNAAGPRPLSRLTRREYNNTVRDLLGDTTGPAEAFPEDHERSFLFRRAGLVATQDADLLRTSAEHLAAKALEGPSKVLPCDPASGEDACAAKFIAEFGKRAYRRPLSSEESTRLTALYTRARTGLKLSFNEAIKVLLEGMLQSPAFLYHWESPYDAPKLQGSVVELGPYDVASRLSYFIWGSMPDQALFDAAAAGKLSSDADLAEQARRMLADEKAKDAVTAFFREWLEIDQIEQLPKDSGSYAEYNDALKTAMVGETEAFVRSVMFDGDGKLETLLSASYSFSNQTLGKVYNNGATGAAFVKTNLDPTQRLGVLTQPSFLTTTGAPNASHPVKRGKAVLEKLLCGELPPPPPNVPPAKPASAGGTTRQRFAEHAENACAKGCHALMDPLGFAFERYDGIGRYRTTDNMQPVDSSGVVQLDDTPRAFADAVELTKILSTSATVRSCFAKQWFRFALGRHETAGDGASIAKIESAFAAHEFNMRDLAPAIAAARSFRFRSLAVGEKTP